MQVSAISRIGSDDPSRCSSLGQLRELRIHALYALELLNRGPAVRSHLPTEVIKHVVSYLSPRRLLAGLVAAKDGSPLHVRPPLPSLGSITSTGGLINAESNISMEIYKLRTIDRELYIKSGESCMLVHDTRLYIHSCNDGGDEGSKNWRGIEVFDVSDVSNVTLLTVIKCHTRKISSMCAWNGLYFCTYQEGRESGFQVYKIPPAGRYMLVAEIPSVVSLLALAVDRHYLYVTGMTASIECYDCREFLDIAHRQSQGHTAGAEVFTPRASSKWTPRSFDSQESFVQFRDMCIADGYIYALSLDDGSILVFSTINEGDDDHELRPVATIPQLTFLQGRPIVPHITRIHIHPESQAIYLSTGKEVIMYPPLRCLLAMEGVKKTADPAYARQRLSEAERLELYRQLVEVERGHQVRVQSSMHDDGLSLLQSPFRPEQDQSSLHFVRRGDEIVPMCVCHSGQSGLGGNRLNIGGDGSVFLTAILQREQGNYLVCYSRTNQKLDLWVDNPDHASEERSLHIFAV